MECHEWASNGRCPLTVEYRVSIITRSNGKLLRVVKWFACGVHLVRVFNALQGSREEIVLVERHAGGEPCPRES